MKTFESSSHPTNIMIVEDGIKRPLDPRIDLVNHSGGGFEFGYGGSGPATLALAILAEVAGDDRIALGFYQRFKWDCIAGYSRDKPFQMSEEYVKNWLKNHGAIE